MEGPYGTQLPTLTKIETNQVAISAGLGITAVYAELYRAAQLTMNTAEFSHQLVWIINNPSHVEWFHEELTRLAKVGCKIEIICTKGPQITKENLEINEDKMQIVASIDSAQSSGSSTVEKNATEIFYTKDNIQYLEARPDLGQLIASAIHISETQQPHPRALNILTCGPSGFNDKIRYHMREELKKEIKINVDFDEKSFTW